MLIVCPSCASEYTIDPAYVSPDGRNVRCAACREKFFVGPPEDDAPPAAAASALDDEWAAAIEEVSHRSEPLSVDASTGRDVPAQGNGERGKKSRKKGKAAPVAKTGFLARFAPAPGNQIPAAIALLCLLVGLPIAGVLARDRIVESVPDMAGLYEAVGLRVNLRGIDFAGITTVVTKEPGGDVLVVEGEIVNPTGRERRVPAILISLRDDTQQSLYSWTSEPPRTSLAGGESVRFRARLVAPPAEARQVLVRFAPGRDGTAVAAQAP